jgi:hypothetical protein
MGVTVWDPMLVSTLVASGAVGTTANPTYSSGTPAVIPEMSATITASGVHVSMRFEGTFELQDGDAFDVALYRDGVLIEGKTRRLAFNGGVGVLDPAASLVMPVSLQKLILNETEGSHTYNVRWTRISGTARAYDVQRDFAVIEVPATVVS